MLRRQVLINALMSVMQILVTSGILFILYRYLLNTLGVEALGVWSLVLATTSVSQIANLGLSGSVVKFVAKYIARGEHKNVSAVIQTAGLSVALFVGIVLMAGYPLAKWLLGLVIPDASLHLAVSILPHAFVALWLLMITSIFQAGLDGYQRIDVRSILLMGGVTFHLILCFVLAPKYGLKGVAYARVLQNLIVLLISWLVLKKYIKILPIIPYQWNRSSFKEIIRYGLNFQVITVTTMLYDPVTKGLLSKFGDLSMVGFYEMASRMVQQFRALITSAIQVLVPAIADLQEKAPEKIKFVYLTSYQLLFYLAVPLYSLIIIYIPVISELWIGHYEKAFVTIATLLSMGWFLNTLSVPAYFANLGIGELRWNVIGHISIGIMNAAFGVLSGVFFGGTGVVTAWVFSLALGSSLLYLSYHIKHKIPLIELFPKASRMILIVSIVCIFVAHNIPYKPGSDFNPITIGVVTVILFSISWIHPMRKRLVDWIATELLNKKALKQGK